MKKKNILLLLFGLMFSFSINSVWAMEVEDGWTLLEEGSVTVEVDKLEEFEEKLAYRVNTFNKLGLDRIYRYRIESDYDKSLEDYLEISNNKAFESEDEALAWALENEPFNEGYSFVTNIIKSFGVDKVLELMRFETKEEANAKVDEFISYVDEDSADTTILEVRDETGDVVVGVENTYKFDTFDDAYNASLELIENNHDYVITVSVYEGTPEYVETDTITISSIFDTKEDANNYVALLEKKGYTVEYEIVEVNEVSDLDTTYETKESAEEALEKFLNLYPNTVTSDIVEVRDENGDTTVDVDNDYIFNTREEAQEKADSLKENEHYYVVEVSVVKTEPEYVETITESFSATFRTMDEVNAYIGFIEENGYTVEYEVEEINELSTLDEIYETSEEAEGALEEFLKDYPETVISNIDEVRDEDGDITEKVDNNYKFDTYEEAYNASLDLVEDNHDYIVEINVYEGNPELVDTETLTINKIFDNKEEATNYISSLEKDGYVVEATIVEVEEVSVLNQIYNTYEEAEEALALFRENLKELSNSNISEVRDTTEDNVITNKGTIEYSTYEEALKEANSLNENSATYQVVANVREENKNVVIGPTNVESDQFDTYEEAINYIAELEEAGYDVSNLKIELIPFEESIWGDDEDVEVNPGEDDDTKFTYNHFDVTLITKFTKIDSMGNKSTVTGSIAISNVKIANKTVAMNGPSKDPNGGYTEYTSRDRNRLNVTEDSLVEINGTVTYFDSTTNKEKTLPFTISGYLSESQNVCGGRGNSKGFDLEFESVTIINNKVVIDTNIVSKYKVVGTITKNEVQSVYYVDTIKTIYGYDYSVNASGTKLAGYQVNGNAIKNTYKDVYLLDIKKTTLDYDYRVMADGVKFIGYQVNGIKEMDIYKDVYLLDIKKTTLDYDYRVMADGVKFIGYQVNGNASKDVYKDVYLLDMKKTTLDYDYEVSGTGIKTYYDIMSSYVKLTDVDYIIEYMDLGKGGDVEELPPQTGVNAGLSIFNNVVILIMGLVLVIKKTLV